ncbi:MAG TPA: NAD(P)/FAD-dependent oxidoreductase [Dehalococcoidia bacterium]|nr:NAD(P)/FAD-dependent oxidoreductase [Dehalococcoidia bacterium]
MELYDCVIVGGGPAGLSAAIYLARFNRSALVLDRGGGRWVTHEINENYLGFPDGIASRDLRDLGRRQAERFGARVLETAITSLRRTDGAFVADDGEAEFLGRTLILATGAIDLFPEFDALEACMGKSVFWCITCDGWKARDKRVAVVGATDAAAVTCMQFLQFTPQLAFVTNRPPGEAQVSPRRLRALHDAGIPFFEGAIAGIEETDGLIRALRLDTGARIEAHMLFNQQGSRPNSRLAQDLRVACTPHGWILTDDEQRTNVPMLYAAGDVTRLYAHQIVTAAHEGATAAQAANYDLYRPEQRE